MARTTPLFHRGHYNKLAAILGRQLAKTERVADFNAQAVFEDLTLAISNEFLDDNEEYDEGQFLENMTKHYREYKAVLELGHDPTANQR